MAGNIVIVKGSPRKNGNSAIPAEIVGIVYGCASDAGEIRKNQEVVEKAYELGKKLGSGVEA